MQTEPHYISRSGWLRAAVLGANDGILSTASLVVGVAAASSARAPIVLAGLAGLIAGALSMAAGEYVSVSSQSDIETADLRREQMELDTMPEEELLELAKVYEQRGLSKVLALEVAKQLTSHNALEAHARDELGINEITQARPLQAALASAASFICGGTMPLLVAIFAPVAQIEIFEYASSMFFLAVFGVIAARAGGSDVVKAVIRICLWGTIAMLFTAFAGYLFGTRVS